MEKYIKQFCKNPCKKCIVKTICSKECDDKLYSVNTRAFVIIIITTLFEALLILK
jgi:hypothetical protein